MPCSHETIVLSKNLLITYMQNIIDRNDFIPLDLEYIEFHYLSYICMLVYRVRFANSLHLFTVLFIVLIGNIKMAMNTAPEMHMLM